MEAAGEAAPAPAALPCDLCALVGRTPHIALRKIEPDIDCEIIAKLEAFNPAGSVKDRIGLSMIAAAEREGLIRPGRTTVYESTSGNTGIALAFVCAARGYRLVLTLPEGMSRERQTLLGLYGADVVVTESMGGMDEAVECAERLCREDADGFLAGQFDNPANPEIHRRTTAQEILAATGGRVDVFVAGVGTGGTITGVGEVLKSHAARTRVVGVEPAGSPVLSGGRPGPHKIQGIGAGFVPSVLNRSVIDAVVTVSDDDAISTAQALARREGVLAGISSGAAVWAALEQARRPGMAGKRIVVILPDSGERYVSLPFFGSFSCGSDRRVRG